MSLSTRSTGDRGGRAPLSRRAFLRMLAIGTGASLLAACQSAPASPAKPAEQAPAKAAQAPTSAPTPAPTVARPTGLASPAASPAAAAKPAAPAAGAAPSADLTLVLGVDVITMDPTRTNSAPEQSIMRHMYGQLIRLNHEMKWEPNLATSFRNVDPTTWEFKLRQGVKFHNGEEFDAEAVKFTIDRAADPNTKTALASFIAGVKGAEIVDKYTVHVKTDGPNPSLPVRSASTPMLMLPPKYFQQVGPEGITSRPIGTGPYRFVEWVKNDHFTIEANPDYWGDKPIFRRVTYKPAPEASTRMAMLQTGQTDIALNLTPDMAKVIENDGKLGLASKPSTGIFIVQLNALGDGVTKDKRVRQALNYAIDKQALTKNVLLGYGQAVPGVSIPEGECYNPNVQGYGYDPDKAKALLQEAGANGASLRFVHTVGRYLLDKEVAQAIADQLRRVGLNVTLETYELGRYLQLVNNPDYKQRPDMYMIQFGTGSAFTAPELAWYPTVIGGGSSSSLNDPDVNELLRQAGQELDQTKRCDTLYKAQVVLQDVAPRIFLYRPNFIWGYNKSKIRLDARIDESMYIDEDVKLV